MSNGIAHISIDPIFAKNIIVNDKHPLRVFIQLEGDCEGVFVTNKSQNSFDVVELKNGKSNVSFTYTIVANRADEVLQDGSISKYSEERFPYTLGPQSKQTSKAIQDSNKSDSMIKTPLDDIKDQKIPSNSRNKVSKK